MLTRFEVHIAWVLAPFIEDLSYARQEAVAFNGSVEADSNESR
jgi:hypothetical protein